VFAPLLYFNLRVTRLGKDHPNEKISLINIREISKATYDESIINLEV